jgi:biotin transport system substrate-specific component
MKLKTIFIALFAAIICMGAFIAIPTGPSGIPIVLQNMFVILTAVLLGGFAGALPSLLFLVAGTLGLPVFSGGTGGIAHLLGPTGGFLFGYVLGALVASLIAGKPKSESKITLKTVLRLTLATVVGFIVLYIPGVIYFMYLTKSTLSVALASCVIPYIPGCIIKMILTVLLSLKLRPLVYRYLNPNE